MLPNVRTRPAFAPVSKSEARGPDTKPAAEKFQAPVDSFGGGRVTAAEKQALLSSLRAAKAAAPAASRQSNAPFQTIRNLDLMTNSGALTPKSEAVLASLRATRPPAASPAAQDPFAGKKSWANPFEGVRSRDFAFAGLTVHAVAVDLAAQPRPDSSFATSSPSTSAVLTNGKPVASEPNKHDRAARTGVGLSKSGRVAYLVAVEGSSGVRGLTPSGIGKLLKSLGAEDAHVFDAGGSGQLYAKGRELVQSAPRKAAPGMTVQTG